MYLWCSVSALLWKASTVSHLISSFNTTSKPPNFIFNYVSIVPSPLRVVTKALIGGCIFIYLRSARRISFQINCNDNWFQKKFVGRTRIHEYPPPINALVTVLSPLSLIVSCFYIKFSLTSLCGQGHHNSICHFFILLHNPLCQLSLWKETGVPGENPCTTFGRALTSTLFTWGLSSCHIENTLMRIDPATFEAWYN